MFDRMKAIAAIRDGWEKLNELGRFELAREVMEGVHPHNFSCVPDEQVRRIFRDMAAALTTTTEQE